VVPPSSVIMPSSRWQRAAITALLVLPLLLIVVLSAPAWAAWPFLSEPRRDAVLKFLGCLTDWIKAIPGPAEPKPIANPLSRDAPRPAASPGRLYGRAAPAASGGMVAACRRSPEGTRPSRARFSEYGARKEPVRTPKARDYAPGPAPRPHSGRAPAAHPHTTPYGRSTPSDSPNPALTSADGWLRSVPAFLTSPPQKARR
jgi:hypothetical protein